ncbi:nuclear transport factor 2 family protein [Zavarzinia sp. CC-PAN008]|uniref:nuclear transport factor 2 family protein n=1 Tax=Zavarzinia sp. CC-PAN008 TaxID=3243332 RepID=UPI003F747CE7
MTSNLEADLKRLIDRQEIEALKYRYAYLCDQDYDADALAELFTPDATWDGDGFGVQKGQAAIKAFFVNAGRSISFATHYLLNPLIEIDGDAATGTWMLWQSMVMRDTAQAYWLMGRYTDTYVRVDGQWKIASLKMTMLSFTPYEEGPGKTLIATLGGRSQS